QPRGLGSRKTQPQCFGKKSTRFNARDKNWGWVPLARCERTQLAQTSGDEFYVARATALPCGWAGYLVSGRGCLRRTFRGRFVDRACPAKRCRPAFFQPV